MSGYSHDKTCFFAYANQLRDNRDANQQSLPFRFIDCTINLLPSKSRYFPYKELIGYVFSVWYGNLFKSFLAGQSVYMK